MFDDAVKSPLRRCLKAKWHQAIRDSRGGTVIARNCHIVVLYVGYVENFVIFFKRKSYHKKPHVVEVFNA